MVNKNWRWMLAVALIALCAVFAFEFNAVSNSAVTTEGQNVTAPAQALATTTAASVDVSSTWQDLIPVIRPILQKTLTGMNNGEIAIEQDRPIKIIQEVTLANGMSEAVVGLGYGGASTDDVTVMRQDHNATPTIALFKQNGKQPKPLIHLHGAIVLEGDAVALMPQEDAVLVGSWSQAHSAMGKEYPASCTLVAYRWNSSENVFVSDDAVSADMHDRFCATAKTWPGSGAFEL